jgi:hypothetical protein
MLPIVAYAPIVMKREYIDPRSIGRLSASALSHHNLCWETFITIIAESVLGTPNHTSDEYVPYWGGPHRFARSGGAARIAPGPQTSWPSTRKNIIVSPLPSTKDSVRRPCVPRTVTAAA